MSRLFLSGRDNRQHFGGQSLHDGGSVYFGVCSGEMKTVLQEKRPNRNELNVWCEIWCYGVCLFFHTVK